jgi:hypothetical protein
MRFRKCVGPLVLMGLLTACGNGTPSGGFHPSGTAAADPTAASDGSGNGSGGAGASAGSPGAQGPQPKTPKSALAAYRGYQLAYEQAYANNDPSILDPVAMNPLLGKLTQDMAHVHAQGFIWRFHNVLNPKIQGTSTDGSSVVILDCITTIGAYKYDAKTGKRLDSWRGGTSQYQAVMRYSGDIWKISDATRGGTC